MTPTQNVRKAWFVEETTATELILCSIKWMIAVYLELSATKEMVTVAVIC